MLPFLKKKTKESGIALISRTPDEHKEDKIEDPSIDPALEACAEDILYAIRRDDHKALAEALRHTFDIMSMLSSEPMDDME